MLEEEMQIVAGTTESTIMMLEPQVEIVSLPPPRNHPCTTTSCTRRRRGTLVLAEATSRLLGCISTRGLNLWRSWTMVGSGDVTRDVHSQVVHAGNATGVSKSVHAVTIKVNAVTSL